MSINRSELYKAINSCLKPVKEDLETIDKRAQAIIIQLDEIEGRIKDIKDQLDTIEDSIEEKVKA